MRAETLLSPTPEYLVSRLVNWQQWDGNASSMFLVSANMDRLPKIVNSIHRYLKRSVGSFCHAPPDSEPFVALATFSNARLWRTPLTGRRPPEVGRWHRPGGDTLEDRKGDTIGELSMSWDKAWEPDRSAERIPDLEGYDAKSLFVLSDDSPRPVLRALDSMFPSAMKAGLLTAPTPFINGHPHTIYYKGELLTSGSAGLALDVSMVSTAEFNLEPLHTPVTVERARGNMLLSLEGHPNPTQLLIQSIQRRGGSGLSKEEDFHLAFLDESGAPSSVVKILSGDPSRGALSLDMEDSITQGQRVQFMQRQSDSPLLELFKGSLTFAALPKSERDTPSKKGKARQEQGFLAFSEDGFISSSESGTTVCTSPGGSVKVVADK